MILVPVCKIYLFSSICELFHVCLSIGLAFWTETNMLLMGKVCLFLLWILYPRSSTLTDWNSWVEYLGCVIVFLWVIFFNYYYSLFTCAYIVWVFVSLLFIFHLYHFALLSMRFTKFYVQKPILGFSFLLSYFYRLCFLLHFSEFYGVFCLCQCLTWVHTLKCQAWLSLFIKYFISILVQEGFILIRP
jgi:hypothetical protein